MASETKPPIETHEVAVYIAGAPSKADIEALVAKLEPAEVLVLTVRARDLGKGAAVVREMAEARVRAEFILKYGEDWTDPVTGVMQHFGGDQVKECGDPEGLRHALISAGVTVDVVDRAIYKEWKVNQSELTKIAKVSDERREIVEDFVKVRWRPAHLSEKEA